MRGRGGEQLQHAGAARVAWRVERRCSHARTCTRAVTCASAGRGRRGTAPAVPSARGRWAHRRVLRESVVRSSTRCGSACTRGGAVAWQAPPPIEGPGCVVDTRYLSSPPDGAQPRSVISCCVRVDPCGTETRSQAGATCSPGSPGSPHRKRSGSTMRRSSEGAAPRPSVPRPRAQQGARQVSLGPPRGACHGTSCHSLSRALGKVRSETAAVRAIARSLRVALVRVLAGAAGCARREAPATRGEVTPSPLRLAGAVGSDD